ncbi:hypothetical protein JCM8097_003481 [Rhodosporidiobolus ruineniae]
MATLAAPTPSSAPLSTRPGLSRSASVIVTSRRPSLRLQNSTGDETARAGRSGTRPITFALPPSSHVDATPKSPHLSTSPTSFLNRISRKLSQSRSNLVRRVSKGSKASPTASKAHSIHTSPAPVSGGPQEKENLAPSFVAGHSLAASTSSLAPSPVKSSPSKPFPLPAAAAVATEGGAPLKRGLRVSVMRRTKSEAKRGGRIPTEGEKMEELVRRTAGAVESAQEGQAGEGEGEGEATPVQKPAAEDWTEVHSNLGSYFWSDSLGVCWDGREQVHPDLLFSFQPYTSNSDVLPPHLQQPHQPRRAPPTQRRVVYASTLSSFPPRPPLRPRTPEMTPASQIIAEYRKLHGTLTPEQRRNGAVASRDEREEGEWEVGDDEEDGLRRETDEETPRPGEKGHPAAATPVEQEVELATPPASSGALQRPIPLKARPSFADLPAASNPFLDASSSALSPFPSTAAGAALTHPSPAAADHPRSLSPFSLSSAYSTPTSEPAHFQFAFGSALGEMGSSEEGHGGEGNGGGVRMSSEGSETSLESLAAARPSAGGAAKEEGRREESGEEEWKECE